MARAYRGERLNELFRRELTGMLLGGLKDPRLAGVTIVDVKAARDLSFATIYVRSDEDVEAAIEGLEHASGFIRRELGQSLRLRKIPEFRFVADHTLEHVNRIAELLREANESGASGED